MTENKEKPPDKLKSRKHRPSGFEEWGGYMASKKMKLAAQFDGRRDMESEDQEKIQSDIFKGISIFVNGYTKPSADELKRLMLIHGGTYHHYYSNSKTTHTIASNLPYCKIKNLKNQIVVTPDWITDSIKIGKLLPYQSYLLYPPEVINKQQRLKLSNFTVSKSADDAVNDYNNCEGKSSPLPLPFEKDNLLSNEDTKKLPKNSSLQNEINHNASFIAGSNHSVRTAMKVKSPSKSVAPVTAGHPAFLSEFYSHSRLHHLSTAGQELKRYVQSLVDSPNSKTFIGREKLRNLVKKGNLHDLQLDLNAGQKTEHREKNEQVIMHLDMDCFFVSVGLKKHPELKGKPVAVTHSKGKRVGAQEGSDVHYEASHVNLTKKKKLEGLTSLESNSDEELLDEEPKEKPKISKYSKEYGSLSEIASCSYEARKAGVRNGMFLGEALRRCPNLKTIPYDFEGYSEVSKQFYDIVASYTLDIEAISCDELYIDCTDILNDTGVSPFQFSSVLREEIEQKTKCTASSGLGPNMLLARLANKIAKPNGQYYVSKGRIQEFIASQKVKDLPGKMWSGVGYSTSAKFEHMGVITCKDLQSWSLSKLQQEFGPKTGQTLYNRCRGKDNRTVQLQKERKSVSAEINYGIRFEKYTSVHVTGSFIQIVSLANKAFVLFCLKLEQCNGSAALNWPHIQSYPQEEDVFKFLKELSIEVVNRLNNINCKGKTISLKLMIRRADAPVQTAKFMGHGVCDHITKSVALKSATNDPVLIGQECCTLAKNLKIKPEDYRGIGIQLSKLEPVQKARKGYKSIENFICTGTSYSETESSTNKEIFAPKELEIANNPLPEGGSIKDFLSDKSSLHNKQQPNQLQTVTLEELDKSVLNALPEDIQKEVLEMYGNKTSTKPPSSLQHSSSSTHIYVSSSNKTSSKKGDHGCHIKSCKTPAKQNTLLDCMASTKYQTSDDKEESVFKRKASIGGAENINEVRSLVKEWVLSSQVVLEEDLDQFRDFILQVIDEDLKKVDLILKYFHRVVSTANTLWQQAYLTILSYVQQKMLQRYGTMLEAKSDFTT